MPTIDFSDRKTKNKRKAGDVFSGQKTESPFDVQYSEPGKGVKAPKNKKGKGKVGGAKSQTHFINENDKVKKIRKKNDPYNVENLEDYDLSSSGSGARKGKEKLGSGEMRRLRDAGHSEEDIIKYAQGLENEQVGAKEQGLLSKWTSKLTQTESVPEDAGTTIPVPGSSESGGESAPPSAQAAPTPTPNVTIEQEVGRDAIVAGGDVDIDNSEDHSINDSYNKTYEDSFNVDKSKKNVGNTYIDNSNEGIQNAKIKGDGAMAVGGDAVGGGNREANDYSSDNSVVIGDIGEGAVIGGNVGGNYEDAIMGATAMLEKGKKGKLLPTYGGNRYSTQIGTFDDIPKPREVGSAARARAVGQSLSFADKAAFHNNQVFGQWGDTWVSA